MTVPQTVSLGPRPSLRAQTLPVGASMASYKSALRSLITLSFCTRYGDLATCGVFVFVSQKRKCHYSIKNRYSYVTLPKVIEYL